MRRQTWWVFFVTVVVLVVGTGVRQEAHGAPLAQTGTLDQAQEDHPPGYYTGVSTSQSTAETFTAGRSGLLDHVDVLIKCNILCQGTSANIIVQIQQVEALGAPNNTLLGSGVIPPSAIPSEASDFSWVAVTMNPPVAVTADTGYALALFYDGGYDSSIGTERQIAWGIASGRVYTRGAPWGSVRGGPWFIDNNDFAFRIYVADAPQYAWSRFLQPVDNPPTVNVAKPGSAVPVKFSLSGNQGLNIFAADYPKSQQISCSSGHPIGDIEQTVTAGNDGLTYDAASDTYSYVWKTETSWKGQCRALSIRLTDGSDHMALFQFK